MRLTAYVMLLFSITAVLYFIGYNNLTTTLLAQGTNPQQSNDIITSLTANITNEANARAVLGVGAIVGVGIILTLLTGGFASMYLIPMIFMMCILNFIVFPLNFLLDATLPIELRYLLVVFFNLLTVLSTLSFVRSGQT